MQQAIREIQVINHRFDPTETVLHVHVGMHDAERVFRVRGRLNGPRCPFSTTIDIAYPLREQTRGEGVTLSAVIPEPTWWDPESPFVYAGFVEALADDVVVERVAFQHAIYWLQMTSKGLRLNGRPFTLLGKKIESTCDVAELRRLRDAGYNWLLLAHGERHGDLQSFALQYGFLVSHEPGLLAGTPLAIAHDLDILRESANQNPGAIAKVQGTPDSWFSATNPMVLLNEADLDTQVTAEAYKIVQTEMLSSERSTDPRILGWIERK